MVRKIVHSANTLNHNLEFHEKVAVPKLNFLNGMTLSSDEPFVIDETPF